MEVLEVQDRQLRPLRSMRKKHALSECDVAEKLTVLLKRTITPEYVKVLENRGTQLYEYIKAFSVIYGEPIEVMAEVCKTVVVSK